MISDDYIMGFIEGEGCFCIGIQKAIDRKPRKTGRRSVWKKPALGLRVNPSFKITAVEEENAVLYAIKERLGVGEVYTRKRNIENWKHVSDYCVQSFKDLEKIAEYFKDKKFYTSKGKSFQLWLHCLKIIRQNRHLTKEGLIEICELREQMNPRLGGKHSRTKKLIEKILEIKPEHSEFHAKLQAKQQKLIHNKASIDSDKWCEKRQGKHAVEQIELEVAKNV